MKIRVTDAINICSQSVTSVMEYDLDTLDAKLIVGEKEYSLKELLVILVDEHEKRERFFDMLAGE